MSSLLAQVLGGKGGDRRRRSEGSHANSAQSAMGALGSANAARLEWLCTQLDALEARSPDEVEVQVRSGLATLKCTR